ncbi:PPE domain-containing protein [Actinokineospora enzanensis]|uniref:PPE domain-containing protein n=1 Tax=Actinokineospora enzanensis TaxID=155975 RepID=UPI000379E134|nr:PPE domain-containing protein [Actinokineospora enzanensis]
MAEPNTEARRWRGFTHKELYLMLHDGPGAQASAEPSRRWTALTATLSDIGQDLATALGGSASGWAGRAAGAAVDRLSPLAGWARAGAATAESMRVAVENQAEHIARARADMPVPEDVPAQQPDPAVPPALLVATTGADAEPVEAAQSAGEQKAFEVMATYEQNTSTNLHSLTGFANPPALPGSFASNSRRGDGVQGTHVSFASTPQVNPVPVVPDLDQQQFRPQHFHGGPGGFEHSGGPVGGQGLGLSAAAPVEPLPRVRPMGPGLLSGVGSVGLDNSVIGLGGMTTGPTDAEDNATRRPGRSASMTGAGAPGHGGDPSSFNSGSGSGNAGLNASPSLAAGANPASATGTPMAPGAGAAGGAPMSSNDKIAMRRFGVDALGSSQWFGDPGESTMGAGSSGAGGRQLGGRRRELSQTEQVTESVTIDGEDVNLPPGVIGG